MFFFFVNPYDIRLFATFILKIFLYLRLLIFDESAATFDFPFFHSSHAVFGCNTLLSIFAKLHREDLPYILLIFPLIFEKIERIVYHKYSNNK